MCPGYFQFSQVRITLLFYQSGWGEPFLEAKSQVTIHKVEVKAL